MKDRRRADATNMGVSVLFETLWKDYHCGSVTVSSDGDRVMVCVDTFEFQDESLEAALVKTVDHLAQLQHPAGSDDAG